jgi:hypothetical protein
LATTRLANTLRDGPAAMLYLFPSRARPQCRQAGSVAQCAQVAVQHVQHPRLCSCSFSVYLVSDVSTALQSLVTALLAACILSHSYRSVIRYSSRAPVGRLRGISASNTAIVCQWSRGSYGLLTVPTTRQSSGDKYAAQDSPLPWSACHWPIPEIGNFE